MRREDWPTTLVARWLSTVSRRLREPCGGVLSPGDFPDEQRRFQATIVANTLVLYFAAHVTYACIYLSLGCYYSMSGNLVGLAAALVGYGIIRRRRDFVRAALVANFGAMAALGIISVSLLSTGDSYLTVLFWLLPIAAGSYWQVGSRSATSVAVCTVLLILLVAAAKIFAGASLGFRNTPFPVGSAPYSVFNLFNVVGATAISGLVAAIISRNHQSIRQESEKVKETLQLANERFDQLAVQSRTITWEVDADGLYTYVSHVGQQVLGYESEELVGRQHFYDLHPPEGRDSFRADALGVFARREPFKDVQNPVVTKDGATLWISTNGIPVLGEDGTLSGYRGTDTDITERKRAEEMLRASEERHRLLIEHALSAVAVHQVVLDAAGTPVDYIFLAANPAFQTHTGLRAADILGRRVTEVLPGIEKTSFIETYGKVVLTGEPISFEQYVEPLGRHFAVSAYKVCEGHFATVFVDISVRKQVEERLRRTFAETERMNRLMSGREDRVMELKREVNALLRELGRDARYGRITV